MGEPDRRFRRLADSMPQLVWTARADGTVDWYNARHVAYAGVRNVGGAWEWQPMLHPDDRERTERAWQEAVRTRGPYEIEHRVRMADGSVRWHLSRATALVEGGDVRWYGTSTDVHDLKVAEAARSESEAQYRTLFESVDQGFCLLQMIFDAHQRPVDYRFLETNAQFAANTGLADAKGRTARELVPDLDESWFRLYGEVALTGQPKRFENPAPALGRWFDVHAFRVGDPEQHKVVLLFDDITARKHAERAAAFLTDVNGLLAAPDPSRALATSVVERVRAHFEVASVTFATSGPDAAVFSAGLASEADARALIAASDEALGGAGRRAASIDDLAADPRTATHRADWARLGVGALLRAPVVRGEQRASLTLFHGGPRRWTPDDRALLGDVATRLSLRFEAARAEEAERATNERYRLLQRATNDVIWDWDLTTDHLDWSDAVVEQFGHDRERLGRTIRGWYDNIHPDDRERVVAGIHAAIDGIGDAWQAEYRFRKGDGTWVTVLDRGYIGREGPGGTGRAVRMIGSMLDLTERKRVEAALEEAARQKDQFLAMLSHELRNPLAPIRSGVHVLRRAAPGSPQAQRAIEVIERQTTHLTHLTDDLLDVTRISRGKVRLQPERLDLTAVLRRAAEDHGEGFEAGGIAFEVELPDHPVWVEGDPTRLVQVVGNLLSNAVKFTPPGGHTRLVLRPDATRAVFVVADDGAGLAPEIAAHLFEPFVQGESTLDRSKGGLGLGLALVKGLVEMHGGTVAVESPGPGRGTTFTVTLPRAA